MIPKTNKPAIYHVIGDIHGHGSELEKLLLKLGYQPSQSGYRHDAATAIFVGDFINRGEDLGEHGMVLDIVMPMVNNGHALAVMGNHEFNALAYHTEHPEDSSRYLRAHSRENKTQHQAFLNEFPVGKNRTKEVLDFFMSLPLFLELRTPNKGKYFRVVHACWDPEQVSFIKKHLPSARLTQEFLVKACNVTSKEHFAVERLLRGVEVTLPDGQKYSNEEGKECNSVRVTWWSEPDSKLNDISRQPQVDLSHIEIDLSDQVPFYNTDEPLCVIGHYWMQGTPEPVASNVVCVDFAVESGNGLTACCLDEGLNISFETT